MAKKPTTAEEIAAIKAFTVDANLDMAELKAMVANMSPGKVVSVDRELQAQNTTLMLMLYGVVAKFGIGMADAGNGVVATTQLPVLQVPANQRVDWEVAADGRSVMVYIIQTDSPEEGDNDRVEASAATGEGDSTVSGADSPLPAKANYVLAADDPELADEFEDEIKVGLDD